ncbi:hypothetical protein C8R26_11626 [Nitrosomonas oligotropha]|uniref:Uncharacterized protein n=1 Tax=Nitrosomonas oligotropha TaxID=42354 RepID=A0A2T5HY75_9PROT|nr:hypothetical protein C8R26_11626 [Nitrosomonas oligotropha]
MHYHGQHLVEQDLKDREKAHHLLHKSLLKRQVK